MVTLCMPAHAALQKIFTFSGKYGKVGNARSERKARPRVSG
ncbi:hypothetical protein RTCIAT899_PC07120 (plasmid) [Rhizobium tropici CIAT 899]|nr:hypothetical protein RTCIAT899_PC07120 [Rhizobium tropici CIAT 899]